MDLWTVPTRSRWLIASAVAGLVAYSWIAAGFRPFTLAEEVMVAIPAVLVFAAAWRSSRRTEPRVVDRSPRWSAGVWLGLVVVAFTWELSAFFSGPRVDHPTLSVIADEVMSVHPGRALVFLLWLALGWLLVARRPAAGR